MDGELKISASISSPPALVGQAAGPDEEHLARLHRDLHAVGPDLHERRAAAFAGMLILGRVTDVVPMLEYGDKPLNIRSGTGYGHESGSLMALMAERWEELSAAFGMIWRLALVISGLTKDICGMSRSPSHRFSRCAARFPQLRRSDRHHSRLEELSGAFS